MTSPFLYFPHERLSPAELSAARLDGHLVELGEGYLPADAIETPSMRAASLRSVLGSRLAVALLSAAWVWGATPTPPARHEVCRTGTRVTTLRGRRAVLSDLRLHPGELTTVGGAAVTTPARTLSDLARRGTDDDAAAARMLVRTGLADPAAVLATLHAHGHMPRIRSAERLLGRLAAEAAGQNEPCQAEVTR